jgi:hypothetical protein
MATSIEGRRRRIDELVRELLMDEEFIVDRHDLDELVRLCRDHDDLWGMRMHTLEREVDILRREKKVLHAEMVSIIDTLKMQHVEKVSIIKSLKDDARGILRGQVHRLEEVLERHDIQYRQEIDGERDPAIKHDFYVGDHVLVLNGLRAPLSWYRPGASCRSYGCDRRSRVLAEHLKSQILEVSETYQTSSKRGDEKKAREGLVRLSMCSYVC